MSFARRCSGHFVIAWPAMVSEPVSGKNEPATALSSVDFPEPLVPMMIRNEPCARSRDTSVSARTSFTVPGLNIFDTWLICSMGSGSLRRDGGGANAQAPREVGHYERGEDEDGRDQLQIVRIEPPAQRDRDQQPEQHGAHHGAGDEQADRAGPDER